jgi:hypothetical protein
MVVGLVVVPAGVPVVVPVPVPGFVEKEVFKEPSAFFRLNVHPAMSRSAIILQTKIAETRARIRIPDGKIRK